MVASFFISFVNFHVFSSLQSNQSVLHYAMIMSVKNPEAQQKNAREITVYTI